MRGKEQAFNCYKNQKVNKKNLDLPLRQHPNHQFFFKVCDHSYFSFYTFKCGSERIKLFNVA